MDLSKKLNQLQEKIKASKPNFKSEDVIKNALIMPFINALGYDVFNPSEVMPEYTFDSHPAIDFSIMKENKPIIFIQYDTFENPTNPKLVEGFNASDVKFAIMTNGFIYKFFMDADKSGDLDTAPFITLDLENFQEVQIGQIEILTKEKFNAEETYTNATLFKQVPKLAEMLGANSSMSSSNVVDTVITKLGMENNTILSNLVNQHKGTITNMLNSLLGKIFKG